jgi:Cu/Ag efflux protein CusF
VISSSSSGGINFGGGFSGSGITLNGNASYSGTRLRLTDGGSFEASSAFDTTAVNVQNFTTKFSFQLTNPGADGFAFTLQGNGPTALGANGQNLGYGGMGNSVAVKFDLYNNAGEGTDSTGLYTNGATPTVPAIDMTSSGVNLHSGDVFNVQMSYNGTTLSMTITDASNSADTFTTSWTVNIPALVGSATAYVGFTGGTGGLTATQDILTWTFTPTTSAPPTINFASGFSGAGLTLNGNSAYSGTRLRLTDGGTFEAASAFYTTAVNVQNFTTNFSFQLTNPGADGITFTLQGNAPTALGANGQNLGYGGIGTSVAVKFDLYNNAGEGIDSTGLYINGVIPTVPAIDMTSSGVNLHSGDVFNVQMNYNGTALSMTITDASNSADTFTTSWTVNIPGIVGGNTAYVGFTGGTGGLSATQDILTWTFAPTTTTHTINFASGFSGAGVTLNGNTVYSGSGLQLTDGGSFEASSAFYTTAVNVQNFTTSFSFRLANPGADGMTFTLQGNAPTALGANGQNLGYGGMAKSVAVKFDLYNNAGEGTDSTGMYTNGATPTVPAIDMTSSGVNLHNGDVFNVQLGYNGTTLTMTITDATNSADTFSTSWTVNIPTTVGSNTAYVGFTAGTGGLSATQDILTWTFD